MNFCERYHYDRPPFSGDYEYMGRNNAGLLDEMSKLARVHGGLYLIKGSNGVGKSHFIRALYKKFLLNEVPILIEASERTDVIASIAEALSLKRKSEGDVLVALAAAHKRGSNIIILIDDADNLADKELPVLAGLLSAMSFIRIFAVNGQRLLKRSAPKEFKRSFIKSYKLRHLSLFEGVAFVRGLSYRALALSQYTNPMTVRAAFWLSFMANRNVGNLLRVSAAAVEDAADRALPRIGVMSALRAGWANGQAVRNNLHQKLSKLFIGTMVLLCLYFGGKILYDRHAAIMELDARRSIEELERNIGL